MNNWTGLEGYNNGAIFSRLNENYLELPSTLVFCTIPRLFTPHCANELKAADDIYREFKDFGIILVFGSTDSPEVAEQYFGKNPVSFPFVRINRKLDYDLGATDRFGDSVRSTYFVKNNEVAEVLGHPFDGERDMWEVLQKAKEVLL